MYDFATRDLAKPSPFQFNNWYVTTKRHVSFADNAIGRLKTSPSSYPSRSQGQLQQSVYCPFQFPSHC